MKCSGDHLSKFCTLTREEPKKCPNCGGNHVANYRGCTYFKNNIKPTFKRIFSNKNTQDSKPQPQQSLNINDKFPTLPNSKNNTSPSPQTSQQSSNRSYAGAASRPYVHNKNNTYETAQNSATDLSLLNQVMDLIHSKTNTKIDKTNLTMKILGIMIQLITNLNNGS